MMILIIIILTVSEIQLMIRNTNKNKSNGDNCTGDFRVNYEQRLRKMIYLLF